MPDRFIRNALFIAALFAVTHVGLGQDASRRGEAITPGATTGIPGAGGIPTGPAAPVPLTPRSTLVDPNKRLDVGDQVSVEIVEDREGAFAKVVTATGDLDVPPLERVHVAGKTTAEAASEIKRRLEADYYYKATVRLSIDRVNAQATMGKVHIQGEVRAPGVLEIYSGDKLTLNEAILRSGNFTQWAKPTEVQITRKKGGQVQTFKVNVKEIQRNGAIDKDMVLQDGDSIFVPKTWIRLTE